MQRATNPKLKLAVCTPLLAALAVLALLALSAGAGPASAATTPGTARVLWKHSDYLPVSQPEPVGGSVVVYTVTRGVLSLRAVDAASGRTLWTRPATRSGTTIGVSTSVAVSPGTAYYYKPIGPLGDEKATLVAVDVRTGKDKWVQPGNRIYLGMPSVWTPGSPADLRVRR